jgi:hypothetical protein
MIGRKTLLVAFAGAVAALTATSVAWACIAVQGPTEITAVVSPVDQARDEAQEACPEGDTCAAPGDVIKVKATGTRKNKEFFLHFRNYRRLSTMTTSCYGGRLDEDIRMNPRSTFSDKEGNIAITKGVVPQTAKPTSQYGGLMGPALVCFIDKTRDITTQADTLTVL